MHAVSSASARARADGGRSRSAVVSPSLRRPSSSPACLTHLRIALAEASNSRANCAIGRPARANSMIRRRYSGAYGGWVLGIGGLLLPFSPTPSTKAGQLHKREMIELRELLERIDRLINEYMRASIPEHLAFLEAEITAAKEKLQRTAASLIN